MVTSYLRWSLDCLLLYVVYFLSVDLSAQMVFGLSFVIFLVTSPLKYSLRIVIYVIYFLCCDLPILWPLDCLLCYIFSKWRPPISYDLWIVFNGINFPSVTSPLKWSLDCLLCYLVTSTLFQLYGLGEFQHGLSILLSSV